MLDLGEGQRPAAPALVEQQYVVEFGVPLAPVVGRDAPARSAMKEDCRLGARGSDAFPIERMAFADIEHAGLIGFDCRIKLAAGFGHSEAFLLTTTIGPIGAPVSSRSVTGFHSSETVSSRNSAFFTSSSSL